MEEILNRIKNAIEFLKDGLPFKVGEFYMGVDKQNGLNISTNSRAVDLKILTKQSALQELEEIKSSFSRMTDLSQELKDFISDKKIKFSLDFNYGMGTIRICSEKEGVVKWEIELK